MGLGYDSLKRLITNAENLHNQKKTINIKSRGSRPPKLERSDRILLNLVYLHYIPTFQMLGVQFGVSFVEFY
ncbi:transposase family protein [Microcoleus sp. C2C3]